MRAGRSLVIGIGNPDRGDDAAGLFAARRLLTRLPGDTRIVEHGGDAAGLLDHLAGAEAAYVIDACISGGAPGTIHRFDAAAAALPSLGFACSTHGLGLDHAIELARTLGRLPRRCIVLAIEGQRFEVGAGLSSAVAAAADTVADLLADELCRQALPRI